MAWIGTRGEIRIPLIPTANPQSVLEGLGDSVHRFDSEIQWDFHGASFALSSCRP